MKRLLLALLCVLALAQPAAAIFTEKPLPDPAQEARAQELMQELRCLVCQNQAISESHAPLAHDLRVLLRERIAAGDTNEEALDFMVQRYGDWVLLDPPLKPKTYVLWFGVPVIFLVGLVITFFYLRRRPEAASRARTEPLSEAERAEIERALGERG